MDAICNRIEAGWFNFFARVRESQWESHRPPVPLSEEFWREYEEPLNSFVFEARYLANALEVLADPKRIIAEGPEAFGPAETLDFEGAVRRLNSYTAGMTTQLSVMDDGTYRQEWKSSSLLGHLAMQAIQDLLGERRLLMCRCGAIFSTLHPKTKYCSELCGNRYRMQEWRKKGGKKQARRRKVGRRSA